MGSDPHHARRSADLTRIAQVVPNLATFAVDDGFSYRIPDTIDGVEIGSLVRVPLGGRRIRGYVTAVRHGEPASPLRDLLGVVGDRPMFTPRLLDTLRWASVHYVSPLSVLLARTTPPNVVRTPKRITIPEIASVASPLATSTDAIAEGRRPRVTYLVGGAPWGDRIAGLASGVLASGRNVAVIVPTVAEARALAEDLERRLGSAPLLATSQEPAKDVTKAWAVMNGGVGQLLVGTREIALWPFGAVGLVVVVEEGRAAMKSPQTPTIGVRDLMRRRTASERFGLVLTGPVPTVEAIAAGVEVTNPTGRVWPLVEVLDRGEEPPGGNVLMAATLQAIRGVVAAGGRVFVFVTRRGDAAAFRCAACGTLRRCASCGAAATRMDTCLRCGNELGPCQECRAARFHPLGAATGRLVNDLRRTFRDVVTPVGEGGRIEVGTERDVPEVAPVDLAVIVDPDSLMMAPHYRAEEDALRIMVRVALTVIGHRGRRCLVQTTQPDHPVIEAFRHGRPGPFLGRLLAEREHAGFPPAGELLAIEITNPSSMVDADLRRIAESAMISGPAHRDDRSRWLVTAPDLRQFKLLLRSEAQRWRDAGMQVRIDADPVRL